MVREAAQLALEAAAAIPNAVCDDAVSVSDRWSWELISEATTTEAEPEELEPLIPLAG